MTARTLNKMLLFQTVSKIKFANIYEVMIYLMILLLLLLYALSVFGRIIVRMRTVRLIT